MAGTTWVYVAVSRVLVFGFSLFCTVLQLTVAKPKWMKLERTRERKRAALVGNLADDVENNWKRSACFNVRY